jgi:aconitase B
MPTLSPEQLSVKVKEIEDNCRKLKHIESLGVENKKDIAKILKILIGGIDNGEKVGLVERVRHLEAFHKQQEEKALIHERSFRNLKNTIIGGIAVGIILTVVNFATPMLHQYQTSAIIEQLKMEGRLQTPEEKRIQAEEVAKEVIEHYRSSEEKEEEKK